MKKWIACGLICLLFCGCTPDLNRNEIGNVAFIRLMGIDRREGRFRLTAAFSQQRSKEDSPEADYVKAEGDSIFQAYEALKVKYDKPITFANTNYFLLGEDAARYGLEQCTDFITRDETAKLDALLFVVKDREAEGFIEEASKDGTILSQRLEDRSGKLLFASTKKEHTLRSVMDMLDNPYAAPLLPALELKEGDLLICGYAVFQDLKLQDYADLQRSYGIDFWTNNVRSMPLTVEGNTGLVISQSETKLKTRVRDGRLYVNATVTFSSNIKEADMVQDVFSPDGLNAMTQRQNQAVYQLMQETAEYAKAQQNDVLQLSKTLLTQHPKEWDMVKEQWPSALSDAVIEISVGSKIAHTFDIERQAKGGGNS